MISYHTYISDILTPSLEALLHKHSAAPPQVQNLAKVVAHHPPRHRYAVRNANMKHNSVEMPQSPPLLLQMLHHIFSTSSLLVWVGFEERVDV